MQGFCTSGGYSHHLGQSIALGLIPRVEERDDLTVEIEILGKKHKARLIRETGFDPEGTRMRG